MQQKTFVKKYLLTKGEALDKECYHCKHGGKMVKTMERETKAQTGTFLLRNLDKNIWTRARAKAILDGITMTRLVSVLLLKYVNDEVEV